MAPGGGGTGRHGGNDPGAGAYPKLEAAVQLKVNL
jgi:hypothetical protein